MNYNKLRAKIYEVYGNQYKFAEDLKISRVSLCLKLNNKTSWKSNEIEKACELLNIDIEKAHLYFFCKEC